MHELLGFINHILCIQDSLLTFTPLFTYSKPLCFWCLWDRVSLYSPRYSRAFGNPSPSVSRMPGFLCVPPSPVWEDRCLKADVLFFLDIVFSTEQHRETDKMKWKNVFIQQYMEKHCSGFVRKKNYFGWYNLLYLLIWLSPLFHNIWNIPYDFWNLYCFLPFNTNFTLSSLYLNARWVFVHSEPSAGSACV